jgi:hypothetical protein
MKTNCGKLGMIVGLIAVLAAGASAATDSSLVVAWPESSKANVQQMIAKHGQPDVNDGASMTWFGTYRGRRTVLHLAEGTIEQVVHYRVPADKVDAVMNFDVDIVIDRDNNELSVLSNTVRTNFLLLNLAHDIASGFTTSDKARASFVSMNARAKAGESIRYRNSIAFETPMPSYAR